MSEQNTIDYCAGYIANALANSLKPVAQKDANGSCKSGKARRTSDWSVDCTNGYTVVSADFICR